MNKRLFYLSLFLYVLFVVRTVSATNCVVYFDGIGCSHCARTDPILLNNYVRSHDVMIIEYEIYQQRGNAPLLVTYNRKYGTLMGIPLLIGAKSSLVGDAPILDALKTNLSDFADSNCLLPAGNVSISKLPSALISYPRIWYGSRFLEKKKDTNLSMSEAMSIMLSENISYALNESNLSFSFVNPKVSVSGSSIYFDHAVSFDGYVLAWNRNILHSNENINVSSSTNTASSKRKITWLSVISLAAVDAINPCALAVLAMMLVAIIAYNPKKRRNILLAGVAFSISVFVMYFIYGLLIIKFFEVINAISGIRFALYKALALLAIVFAVLEIKDFAHYSPGSIGTEMPMSLRPKVKKVISKITSPYGAFFVGLFVTLFLLPCTIGPYVIFGGIVSALQYVKILPYLLVYNLVFISPMIVITLMVFFGLKNVKDITKWRNNHIRGLHLAAGIIIGVLGLGMFLGFF